ncbi:MAG: glycosyltransferase family 87 protein [Candidatus Dormibacteraceae bacterium]
MALGLLILACSFNASAAWPLTRFPWAGAIDFHVYLAGATIGLTQGWGHIYDATLQAPLIQPYFRHLPHAAGYWTPFVSTPPAAWLVAPLTKIPSQAVWPIWLCFLLVCVLAMAWVLAPPGRMSRSIYLGLLLSTSPVALFLVAGNLVALVAVSVTLSWRLLRDDREVAAGLVLALAAVKPHLLVLLPAALLVSGRWRAVASWGAAMAVLALLSLLTLGRHGVSEYRHLLARVSNFDAEQRTAPLHMLGTHLPAIAIVAAVVTLVLALAWLYRREGPTIPIAMALLGSLLVIPYLNGEDFLLAAVAALLILRGGLGPVQSVAALGLVITSSAAANGNSPPLIAIECVMLLALLLLRRGPRLQTAPGSGDRALSQVVAPTPSSA